MKYKLRNKKNIVTNILVFSILIVSICLVYASSFYMRSLSSELKTNSTSVIKPNENIVRSPKIDEYIDTVEEQELVEEIDIKKEVTSILTTKDNKYESHIFNYVTGEEITIEDLIKEDKMPEFTAKITELLYLKYPKFIADVLNSNSGESV